MCFPVETKTTVAFLLRLCSICVCDRDVSLLSISPIFLLPFFVQTDEGIIDLPASIIPRGIDDGATVTVLALDSIQDAHTVNVEPLSYEDWELLETGAQLLEDGALLRQVSVLFPGQILPLWVGRKDLAWVRVLSDSFQQPVSAWPTTAKFASEFQSESCFRLVQDTRLVVAPKARPKTHSSHSSPLRVFPTIEDYSVTMIKLAESLGKVQVRTTPGTVLVNGATKLCIPGLATDDSAALVVVWNASRGSSCVGLSRSCILQVMFSDMVPLEHVGEFNNHFA